MFFIYRWVRYYLMEFLGYQGVLLRTDTDRKSISNRFCDTDWLKYVPVKLAWQGEFRSRGYWFYSNVEYRNNFHNSSLAFTDRERDA